MFKNPPKMKIQFLELTDTTSGSNRLQHWVQAPVNPIDLPAARFEGAGEIWM
jgi:hypothetical protein